ncbi:hypothetical protein L210DRAFT_942572 [Boletus edulis BED1]|uniref:Uncharacterized protein n=1 Tax=Boletus edulis BED1 TaxID=1328754 RepID=A0AAD4BN88_BOLED|nr:hypothetical protein L210DRAFT_942572 [Boletus edulis BED1]
MWHYPYHRGRSTHLWNAPLSQIFIPLRENIRISGSDDREYTASRWHSSYYRRSNSAAANALNDLCKVIR